jgi:predicted RNA binding protein YcfA (HicA-like mRNA interferase family)
MIVVANASERSAPADPSDTPSRKLTPGAGAAGSSSQPPATVRRMNRRKLLARLARGSVVNVAFADLQNLVEGFGFRLHRVSGSHHIYAHPEVPEMVNLQNVRGQAKPYQVRQVLRLAERYGLQLESKE